MAIMASESPDVIDERPAPLSPEINQDTRNGTSGVNGHSSPLKVPSVADSNSLPNKRDSTPKAAEQRKDFIASNKDAFASNRTVPTSEGEKDSTPKPEQPPPSADPQDDSAKESPETTNKDTADVTAEEIDGKKSDEAEDASAEHVQSAGPASSDLPAADALVAEKSDKASPESGAKAEAAPSPNEKPDLDMDDAPPEPEAAPAKSPSPSEPPATQKPELSIATTADDTGSPARDVSNMEANPTSIPPPSDVLMTDAPPSPSKVSREREEDVNDEPAAKRVKTDGEGDSGDAVQVNTSPAEKTETAHPQGEPQGEPEGEQASLYRENGEPKNLSDPSLEGNAITPWQARKLRAILAGIKKTKAGSTFKQSVEILWPDVWPDYQAKVSEPTDIGTMEKRLKGADGAQTYPTLGHFKGDLQRLYDNSLRFNGEVHFVTTNAKIVRDQVLEKMALDSAVEVARTVEKKEPVKHHPSRHVAPRAVQATPPQPPPRRPSKVAASSPVEKQAESPAFAIPPGNNGVPLIRRDSTKATDDRPKRPIHPPKNKDLGYEPKKKKKLPPELRFCDEVLTELKKLKYNEINQHFMVPVDPIALNIPNYHKIVKKPMDLQTMSDKLHGGQYNNPKDFEKDFYLIIKNCIAFNGEVHFVSNLARELEELFKREWAKKDDWMAKHAPATPVAPPPPAAAPQPRGKDESEEEEPESEPEQEEEKKHSSATLEALQRRLDEEETKVKTYMKSKNPDMGMVEVSQSLVMLLQKQIIQERQKLATEEASSKKAKPKPAKSKKATTGKKAGGAQGGSGGSGGGGGAGGGGAGTTGKKGGGGGRKAKRVMGALEKDIIATAISNLDGEPLSRAIEIIKKDTNENENDSGELELDIDVLSQDALIKLYDLSTKAFPDLKAEKEKNIAAPPPQEPPPPKPKAGKPKKNKPMGKAEQERRLQQLNDLKAAIKSRGSNSQEPGDGPEGNGASASSPQDTSLPLAHDSEEESSEEE